jgi:hypothetical protein
MELYTVRAAVFSVKQKEGRRVEQQVQCHADTKTPAGGVVFASSLGQEFIRK